MELRLTEGHRWRGRTLRDGAGCPTNDSANHGVDIAGGGDMVTALCAVLGYSSGTLVREVDDNTCPEVNALVSTGLSWGSDFEQSSGRGAEYQCVGFAG